MKILIIGEYSGFAKYLSRGFHELGHKAFVFSWGDSFKAIEQDADSYYVNVKDYRIGKYTIKNSNRIRNRFSGLKLQHFIKKMEKDWDCAIIINFGFVKMTNNSLIPFISMEQIESLLKDKRQIFLSACGGDYIFYKYIIEKGCASAYEIEKAKNSICNEEDKFLKLLPSVKGIVPITIDYEDAYKFYLNAFKYTLFSIIPLPFDVNSVTTSRSISDKIIIMHGVNRPEPKGSNFIIPAMERIQAEYPDRVKIDIVRRVPLSEYLLRMEDATILIDQCYAKSAGMNAIEALAMGKVVLGGNGQGNAESLGEEVSPVIHINPDEDDIYNKLKVLVDNPHTLVELSRQSREFACKVYDCKRVAKKYVNLFLKEA